MTSASPVLLAIHYQNENCHPDGKIKVGIAANAPWREERLNNAKRLFEGLRNLDIDIVHIRLAVDPQYRDVVVNTPLIKEWVALQAWQENTWGTEFVAGLEPADGELVITHTRNSVFHGCSLHDALIAMNAGRLYLAGVSTAYAVEGSARHATDIGYEVTVVSDACATATQQQHHNALEALSRLGEIRSVDETLAELTHT
jgi:nicotinamidase-related amidase